MNSYNSVLLDLLKETKSIVRKEWTELLGFPGICRAMDILSSELKTQALTKEDLDDEGLSQLLTGGLTRSTKPVPLHPDLEAELRLVIKAHGAEIAQFGIKVVGRDDFIRKVQRLMHAGLTHSDYDTIRARARTARVPVID